MCQLCTSTTYLQFRHPSGLERGMMHLRDSLHGSTMTPPYAILHRLSVEDGYGNTPHVLCTEAPCTEYETRFYGSQSVCPFHAIVRLGFHLDTPQKIEHVFDRLYGDPDPQGCGTLAPQLPDQRAPSTMVPCSGTASSGPTVPAICAWKLACCAPPTTGPSWSSAPCASMWWQDSRMDSLL